MVVGTQILLRKNVHVNADLVLKLVSLIGHVSIIASQDASFYTY